MDSHWIDVSDSFISTRPCEIDKLHSLVDSLRVAPIEVSVGDLSFAISHSDILSESSWRFQKLQIHYFPCPNNIIYMFSLLNLARVLI